MSEKTEGATPSAISPRIELPSVLDVNELAPLVERFQNARGDALTIDASLVERIGTGAVQVLLSATKTWKLDELDLTVDQASSQFLKSIETIGLTLDDFQNNQIALEATGE